MMLFVVLFVMAATAAVADMLRTVLTPNRPVRPDGEHQNSERLRDRFRHFYNNS